jgi:hypothetical protein
LCETKSVSQGVMYLDFEHDRPMPMIEGMKHVGRTGRFIPVTQNAGGGVLYRIKDDKKYAVTGTKGYLWVEAESAKGLDMSCIDMSYFENLAEEARKAIDYFGEYTRLKGDPPWEQ